MAIRLNSRRRPGSRCIPWAVNGGERFASAAPQTVRGRRQRVSRQARPRSAALTAPLAMQMRGMVALFAALYQAAAASIENLGLNSARLPWTNANLNLCAGLGSRYRQPPT